MSAAESSRESEPVSPAATIEALVAANQEMFGKVNEMLSKLATLVNHLGERIVNLEQAVFTGGESKSSVFGKEIVDPTGAAEASDPPGAAAS